MQSKTPSRDSVCKAVEGFVFDPPASSLSFSKRLARENGWSHGYALRVLREYRRFMILAHLAGHKVTPSEDVDQTWHLHLTYSKLYRDFGEATGRHIDHGPTEGGPAEDAKFFDWYAKTLESYAEFFGEPPPDDIWPQPQQRFQGAAHLRWVDTNQNWVIPKAKAKRSVKVVTSIGFLGLLAGCVAQVSARPNPALPFYIAGILFAMVAGIVVAAILKGIAEAGKPGRDSGCSTGCSSGFGTSDRSNGCSAANVDSDGSSGCGGGGCSGGD